MKTRTVAYWITTALLAFAFAAGGLFDMSGSPEVVGTMAHLGYPAYFATLLGAWKLLGALAIVVPGMPRLKEWAYAGMVFDLTGAVVSHVAVGDAVAQLVAPVVLLGVLAASWALRPAGRVLAARPVVSSKR
jgi:uncharacterized membrane protein YphA (DoxX/SURF4 family)